VTPFGLILQVDADVLPMQLAATEASDVAALSTAEVTTFAVTEASDVAALTAAEVATLNATEASDTIVVEISEAATGFELAATEAQDTASITSAETTTLGATEASDTAIFALISAGDIVLDASESPDVATIRMEAVSDWESAGGHFAWWRRPPSELPPEKPILMRLRASEGSDTARFRLSLNVEAATRRKVELMFLLGTR
jgi:hypothetical protein